VSAFKTSGKRLRKAMDAITDGWQAGSTTSANGHCRSLQCIITPGGCGRSG
jgi:hypothetical protein